MTYSELKIALDIRDPKTVLSEIAQITYYKELSIPKNYIIACDDGDIHSFDENGIEGVLDNIPENCFFRSSLEKVIIPSTVKNIASGAFYGCHKLKQVTICCDDVTIAIGAFWYCKNLTDIVVLGGIAKIGYYAFNWCDNLKRVLFKGKTMTQVRAMDNYPWGIEEYKSVVKAEL